MKKAVCLIGLLSLFIAGAAMAQGPFADVPTDHWAYDAVNELQQQGIVIGYPDGTFGGKRAMTRYEFAMAISRMIPLIEARVTPGLDELRNRVTALENKVNNMPPPTNGGPPPATGNWATKDEVAQIRRLVDEFRDELASLGVDVDALRKDLAALADRVGILEERARKFQWGVEWIGFGFSEQNDDLDPAADRDNRLIPGDVDHLDRAGFVTNLMLNLNSRVNEDTTFKSALSAGNYLGYLGAVDDFASVERPVNGDLNDVYPYWLDLTARMGSVELEVGRIPMMWTPYTFMKVDVDTMITDSITDSGLYPIDGGKIRFDLGPLNIDAYAAKHNSNRYVAGLISHPTSGLYFDPVSGADESMIIADDGTVLTGRQMGGFDQIEQSAGVQLRWDFSDAGSIGGRYMSAGPTGGEILNDGYEDTSLWGADLKFDFGSVLLAAEWAQTETNNTDGTRDVSDNNTALDASLGFRIAGFTITGGWKSIENNFAAPGAWDRIGRWQNPVNVEGWYVGLSHAFGSSISLNGRLEMLEGANDIAIANGAIDDTDDEVLHTKSQLKWAFSAKTALDLGYEWVKWEPSGGVDEAEEKYITIGLSHNINPDTMFRIGYEIVDYDAGDDGAGPYGDTNYEADVAVAQFGVKF